MVNDYFNHPGSAKRFEKGTKVRAEAVNDVLDDVSTGMDKLPTEAQNNEGTRNYGLVGGIVNAYTIALSHVTAPIQAGQDVFIEIDTGLANTAGVTLNVSGTGNIAIVYPDDAVLTSGDFPVGSIAHVKYSDTLSKWVLLSTSTSASAAAVAAAISASAASGSASTATTQAGLANDDRVLTNADVITTGNSASAAAASAAELQGYDALATSGTISLDFNGNQTEYIAAAGTITFGTTTNKAAGKSMTVVFLANGATRSIVYNASWKQLGVLPTSITSGKYYMMSLVCIGTSEANVLVTGVKEL